MPESTRKTWQVTIEDAGNNEAIIPLPNELIEQLGWAIGDEVTVDSIKQGELIITRTTFGTDST